MKIKKTFSLIVSIFLIFTCFSGFSQTDTVKGDSAALNPDTTVFKSDSIEQIASFELEERSTNFIKNQLVQQQVKSFNRIGYEIQHATSILKQGIDYASFTNELNSIIHIKEIATKGIFDNQDKQMTFRNLTTTTLMLNEVLKRTENQLKKIQENNIAITEVQHRIDSLVADTILYMVPADSVAKTIYYQRLVSMKNDMGNLNAKLKNAVDSIQNLEISSNAFKYRLQTDISEIKMLQKSEYDKIFKTRSKIFSNDDPDKTTFVRSILFSLGKGFLVVLFYFINHWGKLLLMVVFIVAISVYLRLLKKKYIEAGYYDKFKFTVQIFKHPVAIATLISITVYQFFLPLPPFVLTGFFWIVTGIALTSIFYNTETVFVYRTWLVFFMLNILTLFDHSLLINTVAESWLILILAILSAGFGVYVIIHRNHYGSKVKMWIIGVMVFFEILAIGFLLSGNYNLGKILMSEGMYIVLAGYFLINTYRLSRNIFTFSEFLKDTDEEKKLSDLSNRPGKVSPLSFIFFLVGWVVLVTRNSYLYQNLTEPFKNSLTKVREIGELTFTYEGIFIFFSVLFLAGFVSKIVSFLAADKRIKSTGSKSSGIGSWLLLIRIGIITAGILIAFRSAGFPMDRITMIISALGIGIGIGLQTIVNNLVSGLIIAFEKPVNLDDVVEIGGQAGKMKSIGIRSSVLNTWDGADVIIPNGDLLNQHLVNWTMGSNKRRSEIQVGVAYGTDLIKARTLISEVLSNNSRVLNNPEPVIWITNFSESSINISIKYWIAHFILMHEIKSELIILINDTFNKNGIVIPFPQQDIHIKPELKKNNETGKSE